MRHRHLAPLFGLVLAACATAPAPTPTATAVRADEVFAAWSRAYNGGSEADRAALYADGAEIFVANTPAGSDPMAWRQGLLAGFPDLSFTPQLVVTNGNEVDAALLYRGTHTGTYSGIPATNKPVGVMAGVELHFDAAGKITREVHYLNPMIFAMQVGAGPEPHPAPETGFASPVSVAVDDSATAAASVEALHACQDAIDRRDAATAVRLAADELVFHDRFNTQMDHHGPGPLEANIGMGFRVSSDYHQAYTTHAGGQWAVHKVHTTGTVTDDLPEMGLKANGRKFAFDSLEFFRFENGKAVEMWFFGNGIALGQQLGLIPETPSADTES